MLFVPIAQTPVNAKSRDSHESIVTALLAIYANPLYFLELLRIMEEEIPSGKTGRRGMDYWQIYVLATLRVGVNITYDRLEGLVNNCRMTRTLLGIESTGFDTARKTFAYQTIHDNVCLLTHNILRRINEHIVAFASEEVFTMKPGESHVIKSDSFVVKTNVHFPTDYNLLWDCIRKSLDTVELIVKANPSLAGWGDGKGWCARLKAHARMAGQTSSKGGKDKEVRLKKVVTEYVDLSSELVRNLIDFLDQTPKGRDKQNLERFLLLAIQHIGLLTRRVINEQVIPHHEKIFSIFEQHTEWVNKGKSNPSVELGKMVCITTNQFHVIVDYRIMDNMKDSQIVVDIASDLLRRFGEISSWSFDKGFWSSVNWDLLAPEVECLVMPKKGKCNKMEAEREGGDNFKALRRKHSAVESNINELEHRGLDRCPDRGAEAFERYVGLAVCSYNLRRIGAHLMREEKERQRELNKASRSVS